MAYDAFLKIDGIDGESTRQGFEKQIELYSFSLGASNPVTIGSMGPGGGSGKASLSSFNFMKQSDAASPQLFSAVCKGTHFPTAKVTLRKAGGEEAMDYLTYEFEKCYIDNVQWSGSSGGDDRPTESGSITFGKVTITYTPQTEKGTKGKAVVASWDLTTVKA